MNGIVVVDKPPEWTSHDVVGRLRRLAGTRKVGHAGTLDPMATGVLVIGINRATRLLGHLMLTEKEYLATIRLGQSTTTDDAEGEVVATVAADELTADRIEQAVRTFRGDIEQVPSSVSAIKVDGKRAYARVRAGEEVRLESRAVRIETYEVLQMRTASVDAGDGIDVTVLDVDVRVVCSSGTYIRALARDLGAMLRVGGHLTSLRRTRVGRFDLGQARTLEQLSEDFAVVEMGDAARLSFASHDLDATQSDLVRHGRALESVDLGHPGQPVALFADTGEFLALYENRGDTARAVAVFV